jgi:hypothetical protein
MKARTKPWEKLFLTSELIPTNFFLEECLTHFHDALEACRYQSLIKQS